MPNDKSGQDKKDVSQSQDVGPEVNESMNLASVAGGGGSAPPTPALLANCTSAVMMDQVLELHVTHGNKLLDKFRSGMDNRPELQQQLNQNSELIPYLNHYSNSRKGQIKKVDTDSNLPQTGLS
jgi:hypothetical protein